MRRDRAEWSDFDMLFALDAMDNDGPSAARVAERLGGWRSRNALLDMRDRVAKETDAVPDLAVKPENRDGGMPRRWWATRAGART